MARFLCRRNAAEYIVPQHWNLKYMPVDFTERKPAMLHSSLHMDKACFGNRRFLITCDEINFRSPDRSDRPCCYPNDPFQNCGHSTAIEHRGEFFLIREK
jgi:hypothetical protein